ncbi:Adipolin [Araneus ventricosus]|uniref:Adipolin n=1 Tax=Araneus ventricosus TaxID=182803 RepID=A0A4Y2FFE1_ARAVE|nr:Adipolin [Araneus ventricosus]
MKIHLVLFVFTTCVLAWKASEARRPPDQKQTKTPQTWSLNPQLQRTTLNGLTSSRKVDKDFARATWEFLNRNERKSRKRSRVNKQLRMGIPQTRSAIGPQGPRGPPGPVGPKGANITKEEMMEEIRNILNEVAHQRILSSLKPECTELCFQSLDENKTNTIDDSLKTLHQNVLVPKIASAFMWESEEYITLPKQSRVELDMFKASEKPGAYGRDVGNSRPDTGKFVAPRSGFYKFDARIHLQLPLRNNDKYISTKDLISVSICINSNCGEKMALETISGFGPGERMTVTIGGMLYLKLNQYVSLFVENASDHPISIFDGSQFTGYLIGV